MGVGKAILSGMTSWALNRLTFGLSSKIGSWMHMHHVMFGHKPQVVRVIEVPSHAKVDGSHRYKSSSASEPLLRDPDGSYYIPPGANQAGQETLSHTYNRS